MCRASSRTTKGPDLFYGVQVPPFEASFLHHRSSCVSTHATHAPLQIFATRASLHARPTCCGAFHCPNIFLVSRLQLNVTRRPDISRRHSLLGSGKQPKPEKVRRTKVDGPSEPLLSCKAREVRRKSGSIFAWVVGGTCCERNGDGVSVWFASNKVHSK